MVKSPRFQYTHVLHFIQGIYLIYPPPLSAFRVFLILVSLFYYLLPCLNFFHFYIHALDPHNKLYGKQFSIVVFWRKSLGKGKIGVNSTYMQKLMTKANRLPIKNQYNVLFGPPKLNITCISKSSFPTPSGPLLRYQPWDNKGNVLRLVLKSTKGGLPASTY